MFCSIAELLMINKTKGPYLLVVLTMDNCLQLMPAPSLIFTSVAMPFWPFTDENLYGYIVYTYRTQVIINYEALVLAETS